MSESIGATLRAAREKRRLTLAAVSDSTRIRTHYLQALENDDLSAMPSAAQGRGFLRIYAQFLGLDLSRLIPPSAPAEAVDEEATAPAAPVDVTATAPGLIARLRERLFSLRGQRAAAGGARDEGEAPTPADGISPPAPYAEVADKKKARS